MSDALHIMIRGKSSFCNYFSELITAKIKGEVYITSNEDHRVLLINAKIHHPHAVFIEDYLTYKDTETNTDVDTERETAILINEIKQIDRLTKVIVLSPRNKSEFKNTDYVLPIKITRNIENKIGEIITGENEDNDIQIKEVTDWSVFYLVDLEIFEGLVSGKTSGEIAENRNVKKCTIDTERNHLYQKTGVKHIVFLVLWGIKNKLIDENGKPTEFFKELKKNAL